jgi:hypothetical protein
MAKRKTKQPPKIPVPGGTLDDLCPICGEPVKDDDEWSIVEGQVAHVPCADRCAS